MSVARNFRKFGVNFETNLKDKLSSLNKQLQNFFAIKSLGDIGGNSLVGDVPVVFCTNVKELIEQIMASRNINEENVLIKFGIDGGGGFFKITLSIISSKQQSKTERFKDGGVRRYIFFNC